MLLTGCGSSEAEAGGDAAPAVDLAALAPGDFPTTPQPEFGYATPELMSATEGQRLAEFVPVPFQIDPALTTTKLPSGPHLLLPGDPDDIAIDNGLMAGYAVSADDGTGVDSVRSMMHAVFRFPDSASATKAANELHQARLAGSEYTPAATEQDIDILPNTLVSTRPTEVSGIAPASVVAEGYTSYGDYMIYTYSQAAPGSEDVNAQTIAKAMQLQEPMLDKFPATQPGEYDKLKLDQAGVIRLTIPYTGDFKGADYMVDYGPRGMAHKSISPRLTYELLTDVGAEHNGIGLTTVYQADDAEGAQRIRDEFGADRLASSGYVEAPGVPGLPDSKCYTKDTMDGTRGGCIIANGRYAAEASAMDDMKTVQQQMAAQYLILEQAE